MKQSYAMKILLRSLVKPTPLNRASPSHLDDVAATANATPVAHTHGLLQLNAPPEHLLLNDAPPKGPIVKILAGTKLLPPRPNEVLQGMKRDKDSNIICINYTTKVKRHTIDGVHAHPSKVKIIPPSDAPKNALLRPRIQPRSLST